MADMDVDIDPVDTPATTSKSKAVEKESKKRFEVKKVSIFVALVVVIMTMFVWWICDGSGTQYHSGHGTLSLITAPFAGIILWISVRHIYYEH
jgi:hypothetical protein